MSCSLWLTWHYWPQAKVFSPKTLSASRFQNKDRAWRHSLKLYNSCSSFFKKKQKKQKIAYIKSLGKRQYSVKYNITSAHLKKGQSISLSNDHISRPAVAPYWCRINKRQISFLLLSMAQWFRNSKTFFFLPFFLPYMDKLSVCFIYGK